MKLVKSLQRLTEIDKLDLEEAQNIITQHIAKNPKDKAKIQEILIECTNQALTKETGTSIFDSTFETKLVDNEKLDKCVKLLHTLFNTEGIKTFNNQLFVHNHNRITDTIHNSVRFFHRMPFVSEISRETGLSRTTIYNHLKELKSGESTPYEIEMKNELFNRALSKLYQIGMNESNVNALKAFLKYNQGPIAQKQTNYIQVNNVTITQEQIRSLPEDKAKDLIEILLTGTKPEQLSTN